MPYLRYTVLQDITDDFVALYNELTVEIPELFDFKRTQVFYSVPAKHFIGYKILFARR